VGRASRLPIRRELESESTRAAPHRQAGRLRHLLVQIHEEAGVDPPGGEGVEKAVGLPGLGVADKLSLSPAGCSVGSRPTGTRRLKFDLIDRVTARDDVSLSAIKNVSSAEEYLGDHFPGFPILPGVMMLETLVQAARHFTAGSEDPPPVPLVIREVRNIRYGAMVRPGESLDVTVTLRKRDGHVYDFQGVGKVNDQVAVQGRFSLEPIDYN